MRKKERKTETLKNIWTLKLHVKSNIGIYIKERAAFVCA